MRPAVLDRWPGFCLVGCSRRQEERLRRTVPSVHGQTGGRHERLVLLSFGKLTQLELFDVLSKRAPEWAEHRRGVAPHAGAALNASSDQQVAWEISGEPMARPRALRVHSVEALKASSEPTMAQGRRPQADAPRAALETIPPSTALPRSPPRTKAPVLVPAELVAGAGGEQRQRVLPALETILDPPVQSRPRMPAAAASAVPAALLRTGGADASPLARSNHGALHTPDSDALGRSSSASATRQSGLSAGPSLAATAPLLESGTRRSATLVATPRASSTGSVDARTRVALDEAVDPRGPFKDSWPAGVTMPARQSLLSAGPATLAATQRASSTGRGYIHTHVAPDEAVGPYDPFADASSPNQGPSGQRALSTGRVDAGSIRGLPLLARAGSAPASANGRSAPTLDGLHSSASAAVQSLMSAGPSLAATSPDALAALYTPPSDALGVSIAPGSDRAVGRQHAPPLITRGGSAPGLSAPTLDGLHSSASATRQSFLSAGSPLAATAPLLGSGTQRSATLMATRRTSSTATAVSTDPLASWPPGSTGPPSFANDSRTFRMDAANGRSLPALGRPFGLASSAALEDLMSAGPSLAATVPLWDVRPHLRMMPPATTGRASTTDRDDPRTGNGQTKVRSGVEIPLATPVASSDEKPSGGHVAGAGAGASEKSGYALAVAIPAVKEARVAKPWHPDRAIATVARSSRKERAHAPGGSSSVDGPGNPDARGGTRSARAHARDAAPPAAPRGVVKRTQDGDPEERPPKRIAPNTAYRRNEHNEGASAAAAASTVSGSEAHPAPGSGPARTPAVPRAGASDRPRGADASDPALDGSAAEAPGAPRQAYAPRQGDGSASVDGPAALADVTGGMRMPRASVSGQRTDVAATSTVSDQRAFAAPARAWFEPPLWQREQTPAEFTTSSPRPGSAHAKWADRAVARAENSPRPSRPRSADASARGTSGVEPQFMTRLPRREAVAPRQDGARAAHTVRQDPIDRAVRFDGGARSSADKVPRAPRQAFVSGLDPFRARGTIPDNSGVATAAPAQPARAREPPVAAREVRQVQLRDGDEAAMENIARSGKNRAGTGPAAAAGPSQTAPPRGLGNDPTVPIVWGQPPAQRRPRFEIDVDGTLASLSHDQDLSASAREQVDGHLAAATAARSAARKA
jgi:hypothetical protein